MEFAHQLSQTDHWKFSHSWSQIVDALQQLISYEGKELISDQLFVVLDYEAELTDCFKLGIPAIILEIDQCFLELGFGVL